MYAYPKQVADTRFLVSCQEVQVPFCFHSQRVAVAGLSLLASSIIKIIP